MGDGKNRQDGSGVPEIVTAGRKRIAEILADSPERWILVDTANQRLLLLRAGREPRAWTISTSAAGIDSQQDSGGTPPGVHRIGRKIGADQPTGMIFRSRRPTGTAWSPGTSGDDLILGRILTLDGQEAGVNRGPGCDSVERYIYIHGTNDTARLGRPVSHGCVRMAPADVAALFERVEEGDPVVIL